MVLLLVATGCSKQKEGESQVFPVMNPGCESTAHKTRYIVKKKNGSLVKVNADSREELLEKYVRPKLDELEYVEADQIIYSNDVFIKGSGEITPNAIETWGPERIQASQAWSQGINGQGVVVAVIDSGVDISHSGLSSKIYENTAEKNGLPFVDDDGNGYIDDVNGWDFAEEKPYNNDTSGHGTHVSGIISGSHSSPMRGVAPNAKILPLDFMSGGSGYTSDAIEAIEYVKKTPAKVINASWGSSYCSKILNDTIDSLVDKNILFIAAAGNSGNDLSRYPEYPGAFTSPAQITVGSITSRGFMSSFSNYGALVDVMAPGDEILSTYLNGDYVYLSGTSMATPMVSGLAALIWQYKPDLTSVQVKDIILKSVIKRNYAVKTKGEINVPQALNMAAGL